LSRVLVVYSHSPGQPLRATYQSHLDSLRRYSGHEVLYLNAARPTVPDYLRNLRPDLVVFHNLFLLARLSASEFERMSRLVDFIRHLPAPKVLLSSDECYATDQIAAFIEDFGISRVFTFAPAQARRIIYSQVDSSRVAFHRVQTAYTDDRAVRRVERMVRRHGRRTIDVGARVVRSPILGRHRLLGEQLLDAFRDRAPRAGLTLDLSSDLGDTLWGDDWFAFLLNCRYTLGVEAGSSLLDRDGSIFIRVIDYLASHDNPSFEEVEAACFPGLDGNLDYRALAPRHLEAVMTRTCQVLVEGDYSGVLEPGLHYIAVRRDFSNIDEVLELMRDEAHRTAVTERAYQDIVASGRYSYRTFVDTVFGESIGDAGTSRAAFVRELSMTVLRNRLDERFWTAPLRAHELVQSADERLRWALRPLVSRSIGEQRLQQLLRWRRGWR